MEFTENCMKFKEYSVNNAQEKKADFMLKNLKKWKNYTGTA